MMNWLREVLSRVQKSKKALNAPLVDDSVSYLKEVNLLTPYHRKGCLQLVLQSV